MFFLFKLLNQLSCLKSQLTLFIIFTFIKGLSENAPPVLARIPLLPSPQTANQLWVNPPVSPSSWQPHLSADAVPTWIPIPPNLCVAQHAIHLEGIEQQSLGVEAAAMLLLNQREGQLRCRHHYQSSSST